MNTKLLKKYMKHVIVCEGASFVECIDDVWTCNKDKVPFTKEEIKTLEELDKLIRLDMKNNGN